MKCQAVKDYSEHWVPHPLSMLFEDYIIVWSFEHVAHPFSSNWEVLIKYFGKMHSCTRAVQEGVPVIRAPHLKIISNFHFLYFNVISLLKQSQYANSGLEAESFPDRQTT